MEKHLQAKTVVEVVTEDYLNNKITIRDAAVKFYRAGFTNFLDTQYASRKIQEQALHMAKQWVANDKPCIYRNGWEWKGAGARRITNDEARKMIPHYSFGIGFYKLSFTEHQGETMLEFNELSENDMY